MTKDFVNKKKFKMIADLSTLINVILFVCNEFAAGWQIFIKTYNEEGTQSFCSEFDGTT